MRAFFYLCMALATSSCFGDVDSRMGNFAVKEDLVTVAPSARPTAYFTKAPVKSRRPTTSKPSVSLPPTKKPTTRKPTRSPVAPKTLAPSFADIKNVVTSAPSASPTSPPSSSPTIAPSATPSAQPTSASTAQPTKEPTRAPVTSTRRPTRPRPPTNLPTVETDAPTDIFVYPDNRGPIKIPVPPNFFPSIINSSD